MHTQAKTFSVARSDYALLLLLALIWSTSFLLIKISVETIPPVTVTVGRLALGALMLSALALLGGGLPSTARQWRAATFVGFFGNALPFTLIHWGEQTINSGLAALFMGVMPVWVVVMAHFFAGEALTRQRSFGVLVAFGGLVVLFGWNALGTLGSDAMAQLAVVIAAICYAITTIYVRRQQDLPMRAVAAGALISGTLILLPVMWWQESPDLASFSTTSMLSVVVLGVFQTGLAALIYFYLIARIGAALFSQINYVIPILGLLWGVLLLGEQPGWREALGLCGIVAGLVLINYRK